jgi:drug/metabolite transporter (DMT)-like permease
LAVVCLLLATIIIITLRYLQNVHHGVLNTFLYTWAFGQSLVLSLAFGKFSLPESPGDAFALVSVGVLMAGGNTFLVLALQVEEAGVVALIRTSEVIFTFFWQWVVIDIKPDMLR